MPSCSLRHSRSCEDPANCYEWEDDGAAWQYLKSQGIEEDHFLIKKPKDRELTDKEYAAVCFLLNEWDWDYKSDAPLPPKDCHHFEPEGENTCDDQSKCPQRFECTSTKVEMARVRVAETGKPEIMAQQKPGGTDA